MPALILERKIHLPGFLGVWDWDDDAWKTPLKFQNAKGYTYLLLEKPGYAKDSKEKRQTPFSGTFGIQIKSPSQAVLKAVNSKSDRSATLADEVFELFDDTMLRMECVLRTTAGLKELYWHHHETVSSFFEGFPYPVNWWHGKESGVFSPKLKAGRRRTASSFQRKNLLDTAGWEKLQKALNEDDLPSEAILELMRMRSKVTYKDRGLPIIEAAIITERAVRQFVLWKLDDQGMTKKRVKELKNDLTFSLNSNVFLPLCLTKTEMKKMAKHIEGVNVLRKLRNDVAHANIGYDDVTYDDAKNAVDSAIALVKFIEKKTPST